MEMILVKRDGGVDIETTETLLEELMKGWSGRGLPVKAFEKEHPAGEILNGKLLYDPEKLGGYFFVYRDYAVQGAYRYLSECLERLEERKDFFLDTLSCVIGAFKATGVLTAEECSALLAIWGLEQKNVNLKLGADGVLCMLTPDEGIFDEFELYFMAMGLFTCGAISLREAEYIYKAD